MHAGLIARQMGAALVLWTLLATGPAQVALSQSADTGRVRAGVPLTADLHVAGIERDLAQKPLPPFRRDVDGYMLCMLSAMANKVKWLGPGAEQPPRPGRGIVEEVLKKPIGVDGRSFKVEIRDLMGSLQDGENELFAVKSPVGPSISAGDVIRELFAPCVWYADMGRLEVEPALAAGRPPLSPWAPGKETACTGIALHPLIVATGSRPRDDRSAGSPQAQTQGPGRASLNIDMLLCPPKEPPERLLMDLALMWAELVPIMHGSWPAKWDEKPCNQPRTSGPLSQEARELCNIQHFIVKLRRWSHETSTQIEQAISAICAVGTDDPGASRNADSLLQSLRRIPPKARDVMGWTTLTAAALRSPKHLCTVPPPPKDLRPDWDTLLADLKRTPAVAAYMKDSDPSRWVLSVEDFNGTQKARKELADLLRSRPPVAAGRTREAVVPEAMWRVLARADAFPLFSWGGAAREGAEVCLVATESPSADGHTRRPHAGLVDVRFYLDVPSGLVTLSPSAAKRHRCAENVDDMANRRFLEVATVRAIRWNPLLRRYLPQDSGIAQDMRVDPAALRHALEALGIPTLLLGEEPRFSLEMLSPASLKVARNVLEEQLDSLLHEGYLLRERLVKGVPEIEKVECARTWYEAFTSVTTNVWDCELRSLATKRKRILDAAIEGRWPENLERYRIWLQATLTCWEDPGDCERRLAELGSAQKAGRSDRHELRRLVDASKGAVAISVSLPSLPGATGRPPEIVLRLGPGEKQLTVNLAAWQQYLVNALERSLPVITKSPLRIGGASIAFGDIQVCLQPPKNGNHVCAMPAPAAADAPALSGGNIDDPLSLQLILPVTITTGGPTAHPPLLVRAALTPGGGRLALKWYSVPIPAEMAGELSDGLKGVMYQQIGDVLATAKGLEDKKTALANWLRPMGISISERGVRVTSRLSLPMAGDSGCKSDLEFFGTVEWAPGNPAPRANIVGPDEASIEDGIKTCLKRGLTAWAASWGDGIAQNVCGHLQSLHRSTGRAGMQICALAPRNADGSAPQRVCQQLDGEADIGSFCTAELDAGRTLRLAFLAPEMEVGKPRLAIGGIEVSRASGKSQFETTNAVLMAYRQGAPGTLCESPVKGGAPTRLVDKHWQDACGTAPKTPAADLVLEALGIEKQAIGGAQARFHVVAHPIQDGIAVAMHADLSSIQLGIPLRLPAYVPMGQVALTTKGVSGSLVSKEQILKAMEAAIASALAEELNSYLSSIDLGLDKGPTFTMAGFHDLKATGAKRVAVFGENVDVEVALYLLPRLRLDLDAGGLQGVVKKVTGTILGELTALTGGAGLAITDAQFTEKPLGLAFQASIDADPLGSVVFRRVSFDVRKGDIRIEFPVHVRLSQPIVLEPIVLCAPYVRIEDRKLSAITIGADVTVAECQAAKLLNLRSSLTIRTANPGFGLLADAVLILLDTLNVADAFGEVDENGAQFKASTLPPIDRLLSAKITAAMGRFDSLKGVAAEVNPREGVFADTSYVVFGLRTLDGMVYFNTQGKVLMTMTMNAPLTSLEARVASDPFPRNLELAAKGRVKLKGLDLSLDVAASDGYAGVGFEAFGVGLYLEAPGLRALGPDALLRAIMALLQFKVDLSALNPDQLARLLSGGIKIKMSPSMGTKAEKPGEQSSKRPRRSTESSSEQGPSTPSNEEPPTQRIPPAVRLDPNGLTLLPPQRGPGTAREDRYFLGGPSTGDVCNRYVNTVGASCLIRFGLRGSEICSGPEVFPHSVDELYRGSMPWLAAHDPLQRQRTHTENTTLIGVPAVLRYPLPATATDTDSKRRPRVPVRWVYRTLAEGGPVWSVMRQGPDAPCNESEAIAKEAFLLDVRGWSFETIVPTYSTDAVFRGLVSDATSNDTFAISLLGWALWVDPRQDISPNNLYARFGGAVPEALRPAGPSHPPDVHRVEMPESGIGVCRPSDGACAEGYYYVVPRHANHRHALSKAAWDAWFNALPAAPGASNAPEPKDRVWETYLAHIHHGGVLRMHGARDAGLIVGRWDWGKKADRAPPPVDAVSVCADSSCEQLRVLQPPVRRGSTAPLACSSGQDAFLKELRLRVGREGPNGRWIYSATASDERAAVALWGKKSESAPVAEWVLSGLLQAQSAACANPESIAPHRFTLKLRDLQALRGRFGGARCWADAPGDPTSIEEWVNWIDVALSQPTKEACPSLVTFFKSLPLDERTP